MDKIQKSSSTKESDEMAEVDIDNQMQEIELEEDKGEKDKKCKKMDKEEVSKEETWINWWKNQWRGSNNLQAEVHLKQKKASGTKPAKDPD